MDIKLEFDYMFKNTVCTHVIVYTDNTVEVTNYTDVFHKKAFNKDKNITYQDVLNLFEERIVPRTRGNIRQILDLLNLEEYDPYLLARNNYGAMPEDMSWIKFSDQPDLTWEKVIDDLGFDFRKPDYKPREN